MLAFKNRFHGHGSLKYVYKNGRAIRSRTVTLKVSINPRRTTPRVAVVISKKVHKGAVGRNQMRRRLYETIRLMIPTITPPGVDIVFIVTSSDMRNMTPGDITQLVTELLQEAGVYKNKS
jgi:ribonuclease P protein component